MYIVTLYNDGAGTVIHSRYATLEGCKVSFEKNAMSTMTFTIYPDNPGYDEIEVFSTTVKVTDKSTGDEVFEGRVLQPVPTFDTAGAVCKAVTCEGITGGICCYLHDTLVGYMEETTWEDEGSKSGLQRFIEHLLSNHNARVPEEKRVYCGTIAVSTNATNDQVTKALNFETTFDTMTDKLVDVFGGEMTTRRASDGLLYLDYKTTLGSTIAAPVALGRNMMSATNTPSYGDVVTRLYPRGCKLSKTETDESGVETTTETEERLSIASVNSGKAYLDDDDAIALYGIIEGAVEWDDVTEALNLKTKGQAWLAANGGIPHSLTVTAYDLSLMDRSYDEFSLHSWCPVSNSLIGLSETLEIVRMTLDVSSPAESTIEFGEYRKTESARIRTLGKLGEDVKVVKSQVRTSMVNIDSYTKETRAALVVGDAAVKSEVEEKITKVSGDVTSVTDRVSTVEQTAEGLRVDVDAVTEDLAGNYYKKTEIDTQAGAIKAELKEGYEGYTDGKVDPIDTRVTTIEASVEGIETTVSTNYARSNAHYGTCATAAATAAKAVTCSNFALETGSTVVVKFDHAHNSTTAATMNVNSPGAKTIYVGTETVTNAHSNTWADGQTMTFVYDGTYWREANSDSYSKIKQTSEAIELKVSKGDVSSQLSVESGQVSITSNRFSWDSTNSSMTSDGVLTCVDSAKSQSVKLSGGRLNGYVGSELAGYIDPNETFTVEDGSTAKTMTVHGSRAIFLDSDILWVRNPSTDDWGDYGGIAGITSSDGVGVEKLNDDVIMLHPIRTIKGIVVAQGDGIGVATPEYIGKSYATIGHTHSGYAAAEHTHTKSQITDFPSIPTFTLNGDILSITT